MPDRDVDPTWAASDHEAAVVVAAADLNNSEAVAVYPLAETRPAELVPAGDVMDIDPSIGGERSRLVL